MDMSSMSGMTATTDMAMTATSSGMSMETSSSMDMGDMDMSSGHSMGGMSMSMADMAMVFFTSATTPLYASSWTPNSDGQYAGTCIFLIALPVIFRAILAVRCNITHVQGWFSPQIAINAPHEDDDDTGALKPAHPVRRPWNINEALIRAILDTTIAGVSYLMLVSVVCDSTCTP